MVGGQGGASRDEMSLALEDKTEHRKRPEPSSCIVLVAEPNAVSRERPS